MKKILYGTIFLGLIFSSCKKQTIDPAINNPSFDKYKIKVEKWLGQNIAADIYASIDFTDYQVSRQQVHWYLCLAIKGKSMSSDFLLLQTDSNGNDVSGKIIHIVKAASDPGIYNGSIDVITLDKKTVVHSAITRGYIEAWHPQLFSAAAKEASFPVPYDELPEVIVTAYISSMSEGGISYGDYMFLQSICNSGGGGDGGASSSNGYGGTDNGGGYVVYTPLTGNAVGGNNGIEDSADPAGQDIEVTFDNSVYRPGIDVDAWMKCFTDIPDEGAACSITVCADLPVDNDPSINVNIYTGATGHCFLQLKKTNGDKSVTQIIGFTAQNAWKAINKADDFVPAKTVDNAGHKYDASLTMNVNPSAFNTAIDKIKLLSGTMPYSIIRFDCLDYDLTVINSIRGTNPIILPKVPIPGNGFSMVSTGEMLYGLLADMKEQGDPEAPNILIGGPQYAGTSHGPCN